MEPAKNPYEKVNEYNGYVRIVAERNHASNTRSTVISFKETIDPDDFTDYPESCGQVRSNGTQVNFDNIADDEVRAF